MDLTDRVATLASGCFRVVSKIDEPDSTDEHSRVIQRYSAVIS